MREYVKAWLLTTCHTTYWDCPPLAARKHFFKVSISWRFNNEHLHQKATEHQLHATANEIPDSFLSADFFHTENPFLW